MVSATTIHVETPTYENPIINQRMGKRIFLKMECYQPTGSFKARGIGKACQAAVEAGKDHLVCSSGGNAGYSAAYAARLLNTKATIVVPKSTPETARMRIAGEGAEVIVHGAVYEEAEQRARQIVEEVDGTFIHPFDDPQVWEGHSTMVDELVTQCPKPDAVVVAVGGAGLMSGLIEGMHRHNWQDVPVIAVETEGAASFGKSIEAGEHITLPAITSIANTLGALKVTAKAIEWSKQHPIIPYQVSDTDAVNACLHFADEMRVIVEPACGAALSLLYDHTHVLKDYESVLMIVCGGAGITAQDLMKLAEQFDI